MRTTMMILLLLGTGCAALNAEMEKIEAKEISRSHEAHPTYEGPRRKWNETALLHAPSRWMTSGYRNQRGTIEISGVDGPLYSSDYLYLFEVLPGPHTVKIRWERSQWIGDSVPEVGGKVAGSVAIHVLTLGVLKVRVRNFGHWKPKDDGELTVRLQAEAGRIYIAEITDVTATPPRIGFRSIRRVRGSGPE